MGGDHVEDDQLVRYLMGDLDPAEAAEVEDFLRANPAAQKRAGILRGCLEADAAADADPETPPEGLVSRTSEIVMSSAAARVGECVGRKRFSLLDLGALAVAASVLLALTMPVLLSWREQARRNQCAQNLRRVGRAIEHYRERSNSQHPAIGPYDNAGMFSVALAELSVINRTELQQALLCPGSELAPQVADGTAAVIVPSRAILQVAGPVLRDRLRQFMGGSYAYRIGYMDSPNGYTWTVGAQSCRSPILADTPSRHAESGAGFAAHNGGGQNVLFADGHVEFVSSCWSCDGNHLFLNDTNQVAAGRAADDLVLAPSGATPGLDRVVRYRYQ